MNKFLLSIFLGSLLIACNNAAEVVKSPPGYDLGNPEKFIMPDQLLEISGISFYKGNSDTLYAQQDEEGKLFYLKLGEKKALHSKFSKRGDYEDVSIMNEQVFLLRSYGTVFSFPLAGSKQEEATDVKQWEGLLPDGEFEGMYGDAGTNQLYVLCKQCSQDKGTDVTSGYILQWEPDSNLVRKTEFTLDTKTIKELDGKKGKRMRFQPSALAQHPFTNDWYIVASVNKLLVVADKNFAVKDVFPLDPARFRQPEGIAFDSAGNLFISNEGDEVSNGNVLKFAYTPK